MTTCQVNQSEGRVTHEHPLGRQLSPTHLPILSCLYAVAVFTVPCPLSNDRYVNDNLSLAMTSHSGVTVDKYAAAQPFRLLALPPELQLNIYRKYFEPMAASLILTTRDTDHDGLVFLGVPSLNIELVCHQVHIDARDIRDKAWTGDLVIKKPNFLVQDMEAFCKQPEHSWVRERVHRIAFADLHLPVGIPAWPNFVKCCPNLWTVSLITGVIYSPNGEAAWPGVHSYTSATDEIIMEYMRTGVEKDVDFVGDDLGSKMLGLVESWLDLQTLADVWDVSCQDKAIEVRTMFGFGPPAKDGNPMVLGVR